MKVVVDARAVASGRGVARYLERLVEAAAASPGAADWHAVLPAGSTFPGGPPAGLRTHSSRLPSRVLFGLGALTGRPRLEAIAGGADVVWLPAPAPVALGRDVPLVLTVHDLSFLQRPADYTPYERLWHRAMRLDRLLTRAAAIVCLAEPAAADVVARRPELASRVTVIAPGVDRAPAAAAAPPPGLPARFLLFVGALEPRKAPEVLAAAFADARARGLDAGLVVIGDGRLAGTLDAIPGVHRLPRVDDATLHAIYDRALALVMPSRLEGFGLPPLEAALHGTPAVVSDLPVFAATIGEGALRVPAGDARALADALLAIAADPVLRERLAAAGHAVAAPLTWERSAAALQQVMERVAR